MTIAIPLPVKTHPGTAARLSKEDWVYPRSEAYEAVARAVLPRGWELYAVLDGEKHPTMSAKDFGAARVDGRACVFGIRDVDGTPTELRASIPASGSHGLCERYFAASPVALGLAASWCEEVLRGRAGEAPPIP